MVLNIFMNFLYWKHSYRHRTIFRNLYMCLCTLHSVHDKKDQSKRERNYLYQVQGGVCCHKSMAMLLQLWKVPKVVLVASKLCAGGILPPPPHTHPLNTGNPEQICTLTLHNIFSYPLHKVEIFNLEMYGFNAVKIMISSRSTFVLRNL
jgi:hypothetical protein